MTASGPAERVYAVTNKTSAPMKVWIEPWGDMIELRPSQKLELRGREETRYAPRADIECGGQQITIYPDFSIWLSAWVDGVQVRD
jgi:hypothetical protein